MKIILLGTGASSGVPTLNCMFRGGCNVCNSTNPKNKRTNTSMIIPEKGILVDCTKHFYSQMMKFLEIYKQKNDSNIDHEENIFVKNKYSDGNTFFLDNTIDDSSIFTTIKSNTTIKNNTTIKSNTTVKSNTYTLKAAILTHEHADAIGGLDSLKQTIPTTSKLDFYARKETLDYLAKTYKYYFADPNHDNAPGRFNPRQISATFCVEGVVVEPIDVDHGECPTNGYIFWVRKAENYTSSDPNNEDSRGIADKNVDGKTKGDEYNKFAYISDCKTINLDLIRGLKLLIIDCNSLDLDIYGHMSFHEIVDVVRKTKPERTILVGLSHLLDYEKIDEYKEKYGVKDLNIEFGYDMMEIEV